MHEGVWEHESHFASLFRKPSMPTYCMLGIGWMVEKKGGYQKHGH